MWHQRSRIQWLSEGDKNTHFFHQRASRHRRKNKIGHLKRSDGGTVTDDRQEMKELTREFYENLYTSDGTRGMEEVLSHVPVTPDMNAKLLTPFENKEIKEALF
jgi:hypothetical protein